MELIDFINTNNGPKQPYIMSSMFKCTLEQDELYKQYMGWYTQGQMIMDPIFGQISYNCWLSKAFKLNLGHNPKPFFVEINRPTEKEIAEHVIGPTKVIPACHVKARCAYLLIIIHRFWKVLERVEERRGRRMVGKTMIPILM